MLKKLLVILMMLAISSAYAAHPLAELLSMGKKGLDDLLEETFQLKGSAKREIAEAFLDGLKRMNGDVLPSTADEVTALFKRSFKSQGDDLIMALLTKNSDQLQMDDFSRLFYRIARQVNLDVTPSVKHMLVSLPQNLRQAISSKIRTLKLPRDFLSKIDDESLPMYYRALDLMQTGSKEQKRFGEIWVQYNTFGRKTYFGNDDTISLILDAESKDLDGTVIDLLERVAKQEPIDPDQGRYLNLERELKRLADDAKTKGDDSLQEAYEQFIAKGCYKKGHCLK